MQHKRFVLLLILCFLLTAPQPLAAQDDTPVRVIPLDGAYLCGDLSVDGQYMVLYENGILQANIVDPDLLPLQLVDITSGSVTQLPGLTDYAVEVAFSPDGNTVAAYQGNGYINLWDVESGTGQPIQQIPALPYGGQLLFMPDNHTLLVQAAGDRPQLLVWDTETGAITSILTRRAASLDEYLRTYVGNGVTDNVSIFALSPDGQSIAIASSLNQVWLWSTTSEDKRVVVEAGDDKHGYGIRGLYFTPDGKRLVYAQSWEDAIYVVDLATGERTVTMPSTTTGVFALSHDGTQVAWVDREQQALYVVPLDQPDERQGIALPGDYRIRDEPMCAVIGFSADDSQVIYSGFSAPDSRQTGIYVIDIEE